MAVRIRRTCVLGAVLVLAACGAFLLVADRAAAQTNTYSEGIPGVPFSFVKLGVGMTLDPGGDDQTLVLQLEDVPGGATTAATSGAISGVFTLDGAPAENVSFLLFRVRMDYDTTSAVSPVVRFTARETGTFSGQAQGHEEPATGVWVFPVAKRDDGEYPGGSLLRYRLAFTLPNAGASGTITVYDVTLEYGHYVAPPDYGGDGGDGKADGKSKSDGGKKPTGVAYMGSSGGGSGGGTGTGSGAGSGTGQGGVGVGAGMGSIGTDAPMAASPRSTAADTVTGYPLRPEDLTGGGEGDGGTGDAGSGGGGPSVAAGTASGGASSLSWRDLVWLAVALAVAAPFVAAEADRRRVRRRLRDLVEQTPDGPAPRLTAPV